MGLHQQVEALGNENSELRGLLREMNIKLEDLKMAVRVERSRQSGPRTPGSIGSAGTLFVTPSSALYRTPSTLTQSSGPTTPTGNGHFRRHGVRGSTGPPRCRPLRRASTPPQMSTRRLTHGIPLYTIGMEPQDDQGLLADFFDAITVWAER